MAKSLAISGTISDPDLTFLSSMRARRSCKEAMPDPQTHQQRPGRTWTARLATASATLASILAASQDAKAAVIKVTGRPVSASLGTTGDNFWDIDGNGINESNFKAITTGNPLKFSLNIGWLFSNGLSVIRNRFTTTESSNVFERLVALASGSVVGPSLPTGKLWGSPALGSQLVMRRTYEKFPNSSAKGLFERNNYFAAFNNVNQFDDKIGYFGFRFNIDGNTHYGYGLLDINVYPTDPTKQNIKLISWAYNTVPNAPIPFPAPPDAVPAPLGLAGLAAGAAWTRKLRRRIREASESA